MILFEEIFKKQSRRRRSMYAPGKNPRSHQRKGGGFGSQDLVVDANSLDAPMSFRRAAQAFKTGGAVRAGVELDKRARSDEEHRKVMQDLLNTKEKTTGLTLAEALDRASRVPSTHSMVNNASKRAEQLGYVKDIVQSEKKKMAKWGVPLQFKKQAHLIIGLPGAGKSTLGDIIQRQTGSILVDSDEVKKRIKGFNGGLHAGPVHEESSFVAKHFLKSTVKSGANFVYPTVGDSPAKLMKRVKQLQKDGYHVTVHHVDVPVKFAEERVAKRYLSKTRAVPISVATGAGTKTRVSFDAVSKHVNGWAAYSAHDIPGLPVRYAMLGSKGYKLPKASSRNRDYTDA